MQFGGSFLRKWDIEECMDLTKKKKKKEYMDIHDE